MAFETFPLVIQLFPVLIIESAAISFIIILGIRGKLLSPEEGAIGWILRHLKPLLYVAIGGPYIGLALSVVIGVFGNTLWAYMVFYHLYLLLHLEIVVLMGVVVGLMLAAVYAYRGVAAYVIMGSLLMLLPNILLPSESAEFALGFAIGGLDKLIIVILVVEICNIRRPLKWLFREEKVNENAEASIMKSIACLYAADVLGKLERRVEVDNDEIAKQIISEIMQSDGLAGQIVAGAATSPEKDKGLGQDITKREPSWGSDSEARREQAILSTKIRPHPKPLGTWILTNSEFKRRGRMNRGLFLSSLVVITILGFSALSTLSVQTNQWILLLSAGLIITSFPLAFFDNSFMQRRLSSEMATRDAMGPLLGLEKMISKDQVTGLTAGSSSQIEAQYSEVCKPDPATGTVEMITAHYLKGAHERSKRFLKRVMEGKGEVYEESAQAPYVIAAGAIMSVPIGMGLLVTGGNYLPGFHNILMIIMVLGLPILLGGILWWFRLTKSRSFHGIRRSWLSIALSYLEVKESGIEDIGIIVYPMSPSQFAFLKLSGPGLVKRTLESLSKDTLIQEDYTIAVEALEAEGKVTRTALCLVSVLLLFAVVPLVVFAISGMTELFTFLLVGMAIFFLLLVAAYVDYHRRRRRVEHQIPEESRVEPVEQFELILSLLRTEYDYPLRLLVVGNHQELLYTGRIFTTSTDVKMQEAVFLPRKANSAVGSRSAALR